MVRCTNVYKVCLGCDMVWFYQALGFYGSVVYVCFSVVILAMRILADPESEHFIQVYVMLFFRLAIF